MSPREELLVIVGEGKETEIALLSSVGRALEIEVGGFIVPNQTQRRLTDPELLPGTLKRAIETCHAVLVLTDYAAELTAFRMAVLSYFTDFHRFGRAASMPGGSWREFHYAVGDFERLDADAERVGVLLLRAHRVNLVTSDGERDYHFSFPVGARPTICGSVIAPGDWDNVPSGETFVLPKTGCADGKIAIDGSFPMLPLNRSTSVILTIARGRIIAMDGADGEAVRHARELFFVNYAKRQLRGRNATTFCELGIGVNRSVRTFHGIPLFDEKVYGTAHVAFGRNDQLGGKVHGASHHDLVIAAPRVYLDNQEKPFVANGRIAIPNDQVELDWTKTEPLTTTTGTIRLTGASCSVQPATEELIMEWNACAGPSIRTRVGNFATSQLAGRAFRTIGENGLSLKQFYRVMKERNALDKEIASRALAILNAYGIIRVARA
ncbi:MAG: aminopeptidase [Gemmatimonadetes bacterium]|nr:aminopeptidase [Gemmatimonadota bacterium]